MCSHSASPAWDVNLNCINTCEILNIVNNEPLYLNHKRLSYKKHHMSLVLCRENQPYILQMKQQQNNYETHSKLFFLHSGISKLFSVHFWFTPECSLIVLQSQHAILYNTISVLSFVIEELCVIIDKFTWRRMHHGFILYLSHVNETERLQIWLR